MKPDGDAAGPPPLANLDFRAVFQAAPDACLIVESDGRIVDANEQTERMFRYPRGELIGRSVDMLVPEHAKPMHETRRARYAEEPERRPMGPGRELTGRRSDGVEIPVEIGLSPIDADGVRYTLAVIHDIAERRRLRAFGSGLLKGAEEERQRIARDLHDDTAQSLAALVLRLQMARRSRDPDTRERLLGELHEEIHRTSAGVRRILRGLRPPLLEESGLIAALRAHVKNVFSESTIDVSLDAMGDLEEALDHEAKLALYRIVQEALSNVVRHADARKVAISLARDDELIGVRVVDDGVGFDTSDPGASGGRGLGLVGIMERAAIIGGRARVESRPGRGTEVLVEVVPRR